MLRNSGGSVICKTSDDIIIWLINIEHEQDEEIGVILGDELLDIIRNLRNMIKRDLILNKIL
jgi:intein-encoded DNA endonuclease-like protein